MPTSLGRILVVDDEPSVRSGMGQILELEGYHVKLAATGREAFEALDAASFDVAFIDYALPDLDGLTLLAGMKARRLDTLTCMITAYANLDTAIAATRQGIDMFLPKPFSFEDLLGVVATLMAHKRLRDDAARLRAAHEASLLALAEEQGQTRMLVSAMRDAVLVVNRDGEVVLANEAMAALLGRPEKELLRQPLEPILAAQATLAPIRQHLAGTARAVFELDLGGRNAVVSIISFPDEQEPRGRIVTVSDITDVRRSAMEKARFLRTMVHELRAPLGAVSSLIEVTLDRSLGDEAKAYEPFLTRAQARIERLTELIGDLLTLARIDAAPPLAEPGTPTPIGSVIAEVIDLHRDPAAARGIQLQVALTPDAPPAVLGADDLRTVLTNLVGNAVKYNRPDGRVEVRGMRRGAWLVLEVADTGVGIARENLARVGDEFFREKRAATKDIEGNGLGLAIVKRLVERAHGRLEIASTPDEGTTVTVRLPA